MVIDGTDPFATAKPNARLVKLLIRARRFNAALTQGEGIAFAALAQREGVSRSYFTRLVRLSSLAPDITLLEQLAQQPQRRPSIAPALDQQIEDLALVIDGVKRRYSQIACWMISGGKRWRG